MTCQEKATVYPTTLKEITMENARPVFILSFSFKSQRVSERIRICFVWGIPWEMKLSQAKLERKQTDTLDVLEITASNPATLD